MTEEERAQWWEQRWRKLYERLPLPEEWIDGIIADAQESRRPEMSEEERAYIMAVQNGEFDKYRREMNKKMAQAKGMDVAEWEAKWREIMDL